MSAPEKGSAAGADETTDGTGLHMGTGTNRQGLVYPDADSAVKDEIPIVIAEWQRNARELVRVMLDRYQGTPIIDVRCWYRDIAGDLKPGRSGINLAVDRHLAALAKAIADAEAKARELGLIVE